MVRPRSSTGAYPHLLPDSDVRGDGGRDGCRSYLVSKQDENRRYNAMHGGFSEAELSGYDAHAVALAIHSWPTLPFAVSTIHFSSQRPRLRAALPRPLEAFAQRVKAVPALLVLIVQILLGNVGVLDNVDWSQRS